MNEDVSENTLAKVMNVTFDPTSAGW